MAILLTKNPIENNFYFLWGFVFLFRELSYICIIKVHKQTSLNMKQYDFKSAIIKSEFGRGNFIKITLKPFGLDGEMVAWQNYGGGGMLLKIVATHDCPTKDKRKLKKLESLKEGLKRYLHSITNPEEGWESVTYEQNQKMPFSAY